MTTVARWRRVREHLRANRYRLAVGAAARYPDAPRLAGTPLLTRPGWVPPTPIPLADLVLERGTAPPVRPLPVARVLAPGFDSYSAAMSALDPPTVFENRPTFRLLAASLGASLGAAPRLVFGDGRYFDGVDTGEAAAHEYAAADLTGAPTPLRDAVGDPCDLAGRPANLAVSALTVRRGRAATFLLHWRDPAKVGHAGGLYQVVPAGVFQGELSLWGLLVREYAEELLGMPEAEHAPRPFAERLAAELVAGRIRVRCHGLGVDPLTFATDLLVSVELEGPVFDDLFGTRVAVNEEGSVTERPFTAAAVDGLPMQAAGEALVRLALAAG